MLHPHPPPPTPERARAIKTVWRQIARFLKFKGDGRYDVPDTPYGPMTFELTTAIRDDTGTEWFVIECENELVHCGPLL